MRRPRILIAGAGVAGAVLGCLLRRRDDVDIEIIERARPDDHAEAGTGLNVGPNALKALTAADPDLAASVKAASFPWHSWFIDLTDGRRLFALDLAEVADNPGIRIRWAELYRVIRAPVAPRIRYGWRVEACTPGPAGVDYTAVNETDPASREAGKADLLIIADGRYSALREALFGPSTPVFVGACIYRLLVPAGADCPIDDYGQWFNGPNRLLAFRTPGGFVYCAGSFPLAPDAPVPDAMKTPERLAALYRPARGVPSPAAAFLIDAIAANHEDIHWARLQEAPIRFAHPSGRALALGDAAHPMVPTLGQGATQAIEDACVTAAVIARALDSGAPLASVPQTVAQIRTDRVRFCMDFSREATDTMLEGADPVAGTSWKTEAPFRDKLSRLYRDVAPA